MDIPTGEQEHPAGRVAVWHVTAIRESPDETAIARIRFQVRATFDAAAGAAGVTVAGDLPDVETVRASFEIWLERVRGSV